MWVSHGRLRVGVESLAISMCCQKCGGRKAHKISSFWWLPSKDTLTDIPQILWTTLVINGGITSRETGRGGPAFIAIMANLLQVEPTFRCLPVGFTYGIPPSPPPPSPLCGASYNTCPHQMPGSGVYIWHPSFSSSPLPLCGASYNTCPHQMPGSGVYIWHPSFSSSPLPLCGASYNTCPHQMPGSGVYIWYLPFSLPLCGASYNTCPLRCQVVEFTYGISPSPPPSPFVVFHIIPVIIRCQAVGFTYGIPPSPPPSLPLCSASYNTCPHQMPGSWIYIWHPSFSSSPLPRYGASYNTCPHQMPGSGVYIWHPSFSSSLPPPLWCFI